MSTKADEDSTTLPTHQRSSWSSFLKSIATFSGDLSSLTAPSFILRWFLATFKGQFTRRETQTGSEKKPLNPILGELFLGSWNSDPKTANKDIGEVRLWTEQVSHHPPVSAYILVNPTTKVSFQGHCAQKVGCFSLVFKRLGLTDESINACLLVRPSIAVSLCRGALSDFFQWEKCDSVEVTETSQIQSSAGYNSVIEYRGKGYFSGKSHTFTAKVYDRPKNADGNLKYQIDGQWNGVSKITTKQSQLDGWKVGEVFLDKTEDKDVPITVQDIESQDPLESRKVWKDVADGIRRGDFETASAAKSKLENEQRAKRKEEAANGTPWKMRYFTRIESCEEYAKLAEMCGHIPPNEEAYQFNQIKEII